MGPEDERRVGRLLQPTNHSLDEYLEHSAGSIIFSHLWGDVLETAGEGFDKARFSLEASKVWKDYIPTSNILDLCRPTPEELRELRWSPLVREEHKGEKLTKHIERAWEIWEGTKEGKTENHPYVVVDGTMGSGKTIFWEALHGARPAECKQYPEMYKDNPDIEAFYWLLAGFTNPAMRRSSCFKGWAQLLLDVQGNFQGYFSGLKFLQKAMAMGDLKEYAVVQDVDSGQDAVYFHTQDRLIHQDELVQALGVARPENEDNYIKDARLRARLLPPILQIPIMVYVWVPFETAKQRVLETRGRDFERQVPPGYLKALHLNTVQWMLAMRQAGVPVIMVDAEGSDFRPGQPDRPAVVDLVWAEVEKAHQELWGRDNNSSWA